MSEIVTCILPVHNGAQTIERAILSAIHAGCDFVLVYDDASTDGTKDILERLALKYAEVEFYSSLYMVKAGVNYARNYLIEIADDGLIIPLDADDTLCDIAPLVAAWHDGRWVYGDYNEYCSNSIQRINGSPVGGLARKNITGITFLFHRKDWLAVGGYDPDFAYCEDYAFQCALTHADVKPKYVETVVYERYLKPQGNERTSLAGAYWTFYHQMAMRKYPSIFAQTR